MSTSRDIELTGVSRRFGSITAVEETTWFGGGGVIGLLGPNGAGKTTLLRMLATVLSPTEGTVRLLGLDPQRAHDRMAIRRQLGYLPQSVTLYPGFTAFDLVDYVAVLKEITDRDERRDEVRRVLTTVGLHEQMHRRIRMLSGGMQRRVALATAMLGSPRLLVLDEPSAGLDPDQRLRLREVLSAAGRVGTVIVSTHQTEEVAAFCQRVVVLHRGRICFDGAPATLAHIANARVWIDDHADAQAMRSWVTATGEVRCIGTAPAGAQLVEPTIDDGYLLLTSEIGAPS